ncbi:MAG TPA: thiamine pyrophosphate-dependent enzyme [Candidatus Brocadiia bacterium]|nr:thiamine pyrophosphate-dependent enzyme [Candidatus Brocadiia bacterium]
MPTTSLKKLCNTPDLLAPGHAACAGCTGSTILRQVLLAGQQDDVKLVCTCATGCMEVISTLMPLSAWRVPFFHSAFENSAASCSGAEAAYRALKKRGKIDRDIRFIAIGGDGGTYDIGFQSLSGALERGHRMLYICYDNNAYMNTGIQRSSATPKGAETTTAPVGKVKKGKEQHKKNLTAIAEAHGIKYVAQASPHNPADLMKKVQKALDNDGPSLMTILMPCHRGWRFDMPKAIAMAEMAVDCCYWPLFEIVEGKLKVSYKPKEKKPLADWALLQGRFKHLGKPENKHILDELQEKVDREWAAMLAREERDQAAG